MRTVRATQAKVVERVKRDCLIAIKQWPGCETVAEIGIVREERGLKLIILNYGAAEKRLADRTVRSFQNEFRRVLSCCGRPNGKLNFTCAPSLTRRLVEHQLRAIRR
jgi:hypothetical protein